MSYHTYVYNKQLFGNNDYYQEWVDYLKSKGAVIGEDGEYEFELDDFMEALSVIEQIVLNIEAKRQENFAETHRSIFDMSWVYDKVMERPNQCSLFDNLLLIFDHAYMFLPYTFFKICEPYLEFQGLTTHGKYMHVYKLKDGCKIHVKAM